MTLLLIPLMVLNLLAGLIGGIWLAFLGEWQALLVGLVLTFGGMFLIGLLMMPSMLLFAPFIAREREPTSAFSLVSISTLSLSYLGLVMGVWSLAVFSYLAGNVSSGASAPVALWSYSTATAAWSRMAQHDAQAGNEFTGVTLFFYQLACSFLMVYTYFNFRRLDVSVMLVLFGSTMIVGIIFQIALLILSRRARLL